VSNEQLLNVRDLTVSFFTHAGEVQAVRGVDLRLAKGETIAIVGESGCGKTVTVQSTMGLLQKPGRIKRGKVYFCGENIINCTPGQLRKIQGNEMAMIFQDPLTYLNPTMRIGDQIAEAYREHHGGSKRGALGKVIEMMELTSLPSPEQNIRRYPHQFSGGMRQRVMVAMALICGPKVLFADEPTTALDVTIQAQIIDLMNSLKEKLNTAIVLITHDLGVVAKMAERIYVMYAGKVVEHGDADTIFEHPRHPYTWGLLKSVPSLDNVNKAPLFSIKGTPPDLLSPPTGCAFAPRCRHAMRVCARLQPEYTAFDEPEHYAACWLYHQGAAGGDRDAG
jgi:oligopeptide transport system ATP-binding protein